jgi:hypothetical protein
MKSKQAIFSGVFVLIIMFLSDYFIPEFENKRIIFITIAGLSGFIGAILAKVLFKESKH